MRLNISSWHLAVDCVGINGVVHRLSSRHIRVHVRGTGIDSVRVRHMVVIVDNMSGMSALNISGGLLDDSCRMLVGCEIVMDVSLMRLFVIDLVALFTINNRLDSTSNCTRGVVIATMDFYPVVVGLRQYLCVSVRIASCEEFGLYRSRGKHNFVFPGMKSKMGDLLVMLIAVSLLLVIVGKRIQSILFWILARDPAG